ncbi:MAG: sugar ABC transporter permease [Anaerolineaceae bacterium]|jgi:ABC-type maltose transport system permease subunit|nr:MAG: sugar ABC transporter permease [Anaerolineaceae bacterium]
MSKRLTNSKSTGSGNLQRRMLWLFRLVVALISISFAIFPVVWIISASLNPSNTLANQQLIPKNMSFQNYTDLLNDPIHPFLLWMWNSIKVSSISAILAVSITSFNAFAFSRFRFKGRQSLLVTILLVQVFPNMLSMVALFLLLQQIGNYIPWLGLNSQGGLILVYLGGALGVNTWLMKGFFDSIPRDLDESAKIDGASQWQIFWKIVFPLVRPILAVVTVLTFISSYSDVVLARVLLQSTDQFTLGVGLWLFISGQYTEKWGLFAAGALMGALPIMILYMFMQDHIVGGLTQGAVKG